jgi:hypothetical protein
MVNYQNGKIYKIEDLASEMTYIGSTTKERLCQRMVKHREAYGQWKNNNGPKYAVFDIFEKVGIENCKIVLIELYSCTSKDELTARESFYMRSTPCVNIKIIGRTAKEYRADNRAIINAKKAVVIKCECGYQYTNSHKCRHIKSKFHLAYIASQALNV